MVWTGTSKESCAGRRRCGNPATNTVGRKDGFLRLVWGLGTRAVDRVEHDYPRLVALDAPLSRPFSGPDNIRKFSQHYMDVLNIKSNEEETISVKQVIGKEKIVR